MAMTSPVPHGTGLEGVRAPTKEPQIMSTNPAKPTHVYGYPDGEGYVDVTSEGTKYPVLYRDTATQLAFAPRTGCRYKFFEGHVVAPVVPKGKGGRRKKAEGDKSKTCSFSLPPDLAAKVDKASMGTRYVYKSDVVVEALALLFEIYPEILQ